MEELGEVRVLKALGDTGRIRILLALRELELCVCQIVELLQLASSTISKHLQILKEAGLVQSRKKGRWVYYSMTDASNASISRAALDMIYASTTRNPQIKADQKRLKEILKLDPEGLCLRQRS